MTNRARRVRADRQALAVLAVAIAVAAVAIGVARQPAGSDELRIHISTLRSQAAELDELLVLGRSGALPAVFMRAHARQLAQAVEREREALAGASIDQPRLLALRAQALPVAERLAAAVHAARRAPPGATHAGAPRLLASELQALELALPAT